MGSQHLTLYPEKQDLVPLTLKPGLQEPRQIGLVPSQYRGFFPAQVAAGQATAHGQAKYTGLHALRHFYASWCINRRADGGLELPLKNVQERLGHSTITLTADRYGHLFPRGDDGAEMAAVTPGLSAT